MPWPVTAPSQARSDGHDQCHASAVGLPLLPVLAALTMAACGAAEPPSDGDQHGRLVVHKSLAGGPIFIEGSVTHVRLVRRDGKVVVDGLRPVDTPDVPLLDRAVAPGTYDLIAVERPCEGNCGMLDPPVATTRCSVEVIVSAARTTRVDVVLGRGRDSALSDCSAEVPGR
jgi:hypothetical protein